LIVLQICIVSLRGGREALTLNSASHFVLHISNFSQIQAHVGLLPFFPSESAGMIALKSFDLFTFTWDALTKGEGIWLS
jgi:hypothetical protein